MNKFADLYDNHAKYIALRDTDSVRHQCYEIEIGEWKLPNLLRIIPGDFIPKSILEIGCATGEMLAQFPFDARKIGIDISEKNIRCAAERFPEVDFIASDIEAVHVRSDLVLLSDIVEHVPDDVGFLRSVGRCSEYVALHLPLEKCWLNIGRNYGPTDHAGHLRWYDLADATRVIVESGFEIERSEVLWFEEQPCYLKHLSLSRRDGSLPVAGLRKIKRATYDFVVRNKFLRRRMFPSHLFCFLRNTTKPNYRGTSAEP